jgi:hypothetical protein
MRFDETAEVSRPAQIASGLALGLLCGLFFSGGVLAFWLLANGESFPPGGLFFFALCVILGFGGLVIAWRLVVGRRRPRDGGLFSPTALRVASVCWILGTGFLVWASPIHLLEISFFLGVGAGLFALASHRERQLPP